MTRAQIVDLLTYAAACDQRTVGESDVLVWHDMLAALDFQTALAAMRQHYRRSPDVRLKPGHIWQMCRTQTDGEHVDHTPEVCTCGGVGTCVRCVHGTTCSLCKLLHQPDEACTVLVAKPWPRALHSVPRPVEPAAPMPTDVPNVADGHALEAERARQVAALRAATGEAS